MRVLHRVLPSKPVAVSQAAVTGAADDVTTARPTRAAVLISNGALAGNPALRSSLESSTRKSRVQTTRPSETFRASSVDPKASTSNSSGINSTLTGDVPGLRLTALCHRVA